MVDVAGARSILWGDGSPTREFLYVDDCVEGLRLAAERYDGADPVNLGTGEEISIRGPPSSSPSGRVQRARSAGTPRCRTASRGARSTPPGQRRCSASGRRSPCRRASSGRWPGTASNGRLLPRPDRLLVVTVGVQWLVTVGVALAASRSGSVYGDLSAARAAVDAARTVADGTLPPTAGPLYPLVLAPLAGLTTRLATVSSVVTVVNILVLAPLASYCFLEVARRVAGRMFATAAAAVWLLGPIAVIPLFRVTYRDTYVDVVLPTLYGLTVNPVYLAMALSLAAAMLALRAAAGAPRAAFLAGLVAATAIACVPVAAGIAAGVAARSRGGPPVARGARSSRRPGRRPRADADLAPSCARGLRRSRSDTRHGTASRAPWPTCASSSGRTGCSSGSPSRGRSGCSA